MSNKKYGLIVPDRGKPVFLASRNVFGNDSDSDEELNRKSKFLRPSDNTARQAKLSQEKAVLEDPTVYQYDEIYDDIVSTKEKVKLKSKEEKKPQYIENLMKAASKRKIENERRLERQIQKERENEGDEFKDKEVFVTSAYKKKLEEMRLEEEKEKREEYLESIGDVTKQKDLAGFYRHLYEQKVGKAVNNCGDNDNSELQESSRKNDIEDIAAASNTDAQKKRNYRKRKSSDTKPCLSDGEIEESDEEINRFNLDDIRKAKKCRDDNIDADSDFSIDESSDEDVNNKKESQQPISKTDGLEQVNLSLSENNKVLNTDKSIHSSKEDSETTENKVSKIDIWKKRTIGSVFEEALRRYYERKATRSC